MKRSAAATGLLPRVTLVTLVTLSPYGPVHADTLCGENADVDAGTVVVVGLHTGDTVVAPFVACEDGGAAFDHAIFGRIVIAAELISQVVAGEPDEALSVDDNVSQSAADAAADVADKAAADADTPAAAQPVTAEPWESQAELGLNGSEGNSERFSTRLGARTKLTNARREVRLDALYTRSDEASDSGGKETTENKALGEANHDWLFPDSPWRYFLAASAEYDQFQDYDLRLAASTGPAYQFLSSDAASLIGRAGLGVSHKIGGDDDDYVFEATLGYDFEHKFSERQKLISIGRLLPSLSEAGEYRATLGIAYDIKLDTPLRLSVRLGIEDRFDSTIEDVITFDRSVTPPVEISREQFDKNELDYYAVLLWDF